MPSVGASKVGVEVLGQTLKVFIERIPKSLLSLEPQVISLFGLVIGAQVSYPYVRIMDNVREDERGGVF